MDYATLIPKVIECWRQDSNALYDALDMCKALEVQNSMEVAGEIIYDTHNQELAHNFNKLIRASAQEMIKCGISTGVNVFKQSLLFDAPIDFDAYCLYLEWNREPSKQFYSPRRKQLLPIAKALQELEDDKIDILGISLSPGVGKALANDTPILTRGGWKCHGDLQVGDEVIGMDGNFKKVIAVHQKCKLDVLVEFANGEKIQCHENHEWMVYNKHYNGIQTLETKAIENSVMESGEPNKRGHRYYYSLPHKGCVVGEQKQLALDPYVLGVWLGDGTNKNPRITMAKSDYAVVDEICKRGYPIRWQTVHKTTGVPSYDFDIRKQLQQFDMCHSRRKMPKYIPQEYLTASVDQRLDLLAGLLDTDGTLNGNKYVYSTTGEELKDTFIQLVSTFGWRCGVTKHEPKVSSSGVVGRLPVYAICFVPTFEIPCVLERKRIKEFGKQRRIAITKISRVDQKEGNCISVEGDGMYLAGHTMLPTHNTTLAEFYLSWQAGKHPEMSILTGSHNGAFLNGVYNEMLRILDPQGEYLWKDVFPKMQIVSTNAKDLAIDIADDKNKGKRFATLEFTSIGAQNAGKVRAQNLLYCDDLVDGIETAMSKDRLDKLWQQYHTDLRQRKQGNCKELHIATRWSVHDVIGRLEAEYDGNDRVKFIRIPALDENDESNFDYPYGLGFTTEMYHEQRSIMDDASWKALYMNEPIEREGLLYEQSELRRYFTLPDREPDAVIIQVDTKEQGNDYCVAPLCYQYGDDFYIEKFICDNGKVEVLEERIAHFIVDNKVHTARFESNRGGTLFAQAVEKKVKELGGKCSISTKWTQANKETKIVVASSFVKEHFLFKDESYCKQDKEYQTAMKQLTSYTLVGKVKHDDVPDCLAMLVDFIRSFNSNRVSVMRRPF